MGGFSLFEVGSRGTDRLWLRGGFPRAFLADSAADWVDWMDSFTQSFVERDIPGITPGVSTYRAPSEIVAAPFTTPQRRVPPARLESPRLHHSQQPRRGQHLARARRQRLGQRLPVRLDLPGAGGARPPGHISTTQRPLHHDHLDPPPRKQPGRRRPGGATHPE